MRLALYQPDIPPNAGTLLRLAACLGVAVDVIEPCGFPADERSFRRAALDYLDRAEVRRHQSWPAFLAARAAGTHGRLLLLTTRASRDYTAFDYRGTDTILVGRETAGVPAAVHAAANHRLVVPMVAGARSLNVALAAAMVLGEALRQARRGAVGDAPRPARSAVGQR